MLHRRLLFIASFLCFVSSASADVIYKVTVNTSSIFGTTGSLDFNFNPGPLVTQSASLQVLNFTSDGTLAGACPCGTGDVSGQLPATLTFDNGTGFNDYFDQFTFGSTISFEVRLYGPAVNSPDGVSTSGSTFAFSMFSDAAGTIPALTTDTTNGFAVTVSVNLDGTTAVTNSSPETQALPVAAGAGLNGVITAAVSLDVPYQVRYAVNLTSEAGGTAGLDAYFNVANDGASGTSAFGSGLGSGSTGNICANLYVFDNQEEMLWCCSCIITPDETIGFSLQRDILSNPLTAIATGSVTVKLVGTAAGSGTAGCYQSAALQGITTLVPGLLAWGTSPHLINQAVGQGIYFETETQFLPAQLSGAEQTSLANNCGGILGKGTGYGTCKSCETNALGGSKM